VHYAMNTNAPRPEDAAVRYSIDVRASTFTLRAFASGVLSAFGHNPTIAIRDYAGEVRFDPESLEKAWLRMTIRADSLAVTDDVSEKDRQEIESRMKEQVLEAGEYPEIVYECSRVSASKTAEGQYWMALNGDLTLHGETHSQAVSARVTVSGDTVRAFGDFSILQTGYGIRLVSVAGGAIKLKDELKFSFNIVARKLG
jgi:polyisoprenoid-binding protein YceI